MTTSRSYRPHSILMSNSAKKLAILFALLACAYVSLAAPPAIPPADPHRYLEDIKALTTPAMEGRGAGSKGLTRAAHLIEKRYQEPGSRTRGHKLLLPAFYGDHRRPVERQEQFRGADRGQKEELKPKQDFVPFSFSASGSAHGPLVFAGLWRFGRRVSVRRLRRDRRQGQDRRGSSLRASFVRREERQSRHDATFPTDDQSHQRPEPRREGDRAGQRQTGRRRRRSADAVRQRERAGECRHHFCPGEECGGRGVVQGGRQIARGNAGADQQFGEASIVRAAREPECGADGQHPRPPGPP